MEDLAAPILANESSLDDATRADVWDWYHQAANVDELNQKLIAAPIPADVKSRLLRAKELSSPVPSPVDKVVGAMNKMKEMDPEVLRVAEKHPTVLKMLMGQKKE
jgi:hypothetical protein